MLLLTDIPGQLSRGYLRSWAKLISSNTAPNQRFYQIDDRTKTIKQGRAKPESISRHGNECHLETRDCCIYGPHSLELSVVVSSSYGANMDIVLLDSDVPPCKGPAVVCFMTQHGTRFTSPLVSIRYFSLVGREDSFRLSKPSCR